MAGRRVDWPQPVRGDDSSENTDKNQASLALGSAEYRERLMDKAGLEDESFVGFRAFASGVPVGHVKVNESAQRSSDEYQELAKAPELPHVASFAGDLRQQSQARRDADRSVNDMKYRNRMLKLDRYPEVMRNLQQQAAATETTADDKAVARLVGRDCDDLPEIINDGLTVEDFLSNPFEKYI